MARQVSIEHLIEIAKLHADNKDIVDIDEISQFILTFNIKAGKVKVSNKDAYEAYRIWSNNPVTRMSFGKRFSTKFPLEKHFYNLNVQAAWLLKEAQKWKRYEEE